jgi:fumarate hydratase class II
MAKITEDAAIELPLNDERIEFPRKMNRHVVVALNHMHKRKAALNEQIERLEVERADLIEAITALAGKQ